MASRYLRDLNNAVGGVLQPASVARPALLNAGLDPTLAGGAAVGVATSAVDTQLLEAAAAIGVAVATASEQEAEQATAIGIATATASAQLLETAAGSGIATAGSNSQLLEAAGAIGVAVASATDQEAEAASGAGVALASADSLLLIGGSAIGESGSLLNLPNGVAVGAANSSADPMLLASGAAAGQADAGADTPPEDLAVDLGDGLPGYRTAPWIPAPVTAMVAGGKARGESAAAAMAIEIWPVPAVVSSEPKDDDLELAFFIDLAAA